MPGKLLNTALLSGVLAVSGCASSVQNSSSDSVKWWNPLTYSWSAALPWHWFGSSLTVTEQGVGGLNSLTPMTDSGIREGLGSDYQLREGMRTEQGEIVTFWQALKDGQVALNIQGQSTVSRIEVSTPDAVTSGGVKIGSKFSGLYSKAFGHCQPTSNGDVVSCRVPGSQHILLEYHGEWQGPQGIMPADATLKNWTVSRIIWQQ